MNDVFKPHLRKCILVFFDDILVYNPDEETHIQHLKLTLELLKQHSVFSKKSKCSFRQKKVENLGHIISGEGVATDPSKVECMQRWPTPTTLKDLRGFLGLTACYMKFVQNYGLVFKPLTDLLKKNNFQWSTTTHATFDLL
ncbi:uncharacterized protein LOC113351182 [Papaver somniferum]|uniref:uncharacterized protein LOC113351182 n=1 Tax=Papaver somniferum TaxID=3469 RepID=UPI000E702D4B|nr:uncharacterized protein LOC113351182 [Papaver somniferum]